MEAIAKRSVAGAGEIAMAKFYIKRLKTRAILSPSRLIRCTCTFRPESIPGGHHARPWRGTFQSEPGQTRSSARSSTVQMLVVTVPGGMQKETTWTVQNVAEISRQNAFA